MTGFGFRASLLCILLVLAAAGGGTIAAHAQEPAEGQFEDPYQVRDELEAVFASPEFRRLKYERSDKEITEPDMEPIELPEWVKSTVEAVAQVIGPALSYFFWGVIGLICVLIGYVIFSGIKSAQLRSANVAAAGEQFEEGESGHAPGELPADVYLRRAAEFAAAGRTREAISQLLLGAMSYIEREGLIRFRHGLTCRDYLRAVRDRDELYAALRQIVGTYEPICFGRRDAEPQHYETSLERYVGAFHAT